ncbi:MAG: hypothetical protein Fur0015_09040 [Ignavibacteriales bacterium]
MKINKPLKLFLQNVGALSLPFLISLLCKSLRISKVNYDEIQDEIIKGNNFILAFWHGTMIAPWYIFRKSNMSALISKSKDGSLLSNVLEHWEYNVVRGSSNDGGKAAFNQLNELTTSGNSILITVDGPKGPKYKMKSGAVVLAQRNQVPLYLLGVGYKSKMKLKSWDEFQIPKPFTKVNLLFSKKINFSKELSREEIEEKIIDTEKQLNQLQIEAEVFD